jgi:hypothetical protein
MIPSQRIASSVIALTIAVLIAASDAFAPVANRQRQQLTSSTLYAVPPMIIGPMIRKMREEQAKKKMPLVTRDEAIYDAPGLRVGRGAWKWPPVWPYDNTFYKTYEDLKSDAPSLKNMASMLSGMPQFPTPEELAESEKNELKFKPMPYWTEDMAEVTTDLDPDAAEKLTR